jgi:uncharacterized membrane protein YgcG
MKRLFLFLLLVSTFSNAPVLAQGTEFDANLQQAQQQEAYYKAAVEQEHEKIEPMREAYAKQLDQLKMSGGIAKHGTAQTTKKISSLEYWLKASDEREARELHALGDLDGWTKYWQSKQDSVVRTQAWNQEQIHLDDLAAQKKAMEAQEEQSRAARFASNADYWNAQGGGYGGGGGRGYGGYHGHSYSFHGGGHSSGGHGHGGGGHH